MSTIFTFQNNRNCIRAQGKKFRSRSVIFQIFIKVAIVLQILSLLRAHSIQSLILILFIRILIHYPRIQLRIHKLRQLNRSSRAACFVAKIIRWRASENGKKRADQGREEVFVLWRKWHGKELTTNYELQWTPHGLNGLPPRWIICRFAGT